MTDDPGTPALTYGLRNLVWGIESQVAVVGSLSRRIDEHVRALNALRSELATRLARLDDLQAATSDASLGAWLAGAVRAPLPHRDEEFPERLYGA